MTDITQIVISFFGLAAGIITAFLIPYIRSKTTAEQRERIRFWISVAVNAAEQTIRGRGMGNERKSAVLNFLESKGVTFSGDEIDTMIEAEVNRLNLRG